MTSLLTLRQEIEKELSEDHDDWCEHCTINRAKLELLNKIEQGYSLVPKDESGVFRNQISEEYLKEHFIEKKKVLDVLDIATRNVILRLRDDPFPNGKERKISWNDALGNISTAIEKELKKELGVEE